LLAAQLGNYCDAGNQAVPAAGLSSIDQAKLPAT
jgi:hypothetical protein